jgi:hypothetical protein
LTEAGAAANSGTAFRMYVESSGVPGQSGNIQSGIAVANTTSTAANLTFELLHPQQNLWVVSGSGNAASVW